MPISTFLNGRAAEQLRGLSWLALSETGISYAGTVASDSGGGVTVGWAAAGTFPCRIDPLSAGAGGVIGERIDERSTHYVTVPPGGTITTDHRFEISGRGSFEITATRQQTSELVTSFEVIQIS
jgi:hypothetical protein